MVVDSGLLIASVMIDEPLTKLAKQRLAVWERERTHLNAPVFIRCEVVSFIRKAVYQKRLDEADANFPLQVLINYPLDLHMDAALLARVYQLASGFGMVRAYDAQYLALAERLDCEFWTIDEKLVNTVNAALPWVKFLGSWTLPQNKEDAKP